MCSSDLELNPSVDLLVRSSLYAFSLLTFTYLLPPGMVLTNDLGISILIQRKTAEAVCDFRKTPIYIVGPYAALRLSPCILQIQRLGLTEHVV